MKSHFCRIEGTTVEFEGECNWCGAKEVVLPKLTDEVIAELWHKADHHLYKFAKLIRDWLEEHGSRY